MMDIYDVVISHIIFFYFLGGVLSSLPSCHTRAAITAIMITEPITICVGVTPLGISSEVVAIFGRLVGIDAFTVVDVTDTVVVGCNGIHLQLLHNQSPKPQGVISVSHSSPISCIRFPQMGPIVVGVAGMGIVVLGMVVTGSCIVVVGSGVVVEVGVSFDSTVIFRGSVVVVCAVGNVVVMVVGGEVVFCGPSSRDIHGGKTVTGVVELSICFMHLLFMKFLISHEALPI